MPRRLIVWFVLVPAEAALAGGRPAVLRAAGAAAFALIAVAALQALGAAAGVAAAASDLGDLRRSRCFAAVMQAALVAAAAQDRQRAADLAAAEGAAMYRFLADNAMDLITRHSSDGRIRFASPAAQSAPRTCRREELVGLAPAALVHPDDLRAMQAAFMESSLFRPRRHRRRCA